MNDFKLIVEGTGDQKFIIDFVKIHFNIDISKKDVIDIGGITNFLDYQQLYKKNTDNGGINLAILDADYVENGGSFAIRMKHWTNLIKKNSISMDIFLFPNNQDDGDLETFLENTINKSHQEIFTCWQNYEACISNISGTDYTIPAKKSKIYSFLECLLPNTKTGKDLVKDPNRDYANKDHWELDNLQNSYVSSLKSFLEKAFV